MKRPTSLAILRSASVSLAITLAVITCFSTFAKGQAIIDSAGSDIIPWDPALRSILQRLMKC